VISTRSVIAGLHTPEPVPTRVGRSAGPWLWMSIAAAVIAAAGSIVGLTAVGSIYGRETAAFVDEAIAQDIVNLVVVAPAIIVSALLARRGSLPAWLAWLGAMAFTVYNYVIYTLSIHAGPLFLAWVAVLGLSLYALIGGLGALDPRSVRTRFVSAPRRTVGWFLIVVAALFGGLWLTDIVPALLSGQVPAAARDLGLPSSPVHVLDLAFYLPVAFTAGVLLLRNRARGYVLAPALLGFLILTGLPIMVTPFVASQRGDTPGWAVLAPITTVTIVSTVLLIRLLSAIREPTGPIITATASESR
jgi:hypothetical protein